MIINYKLLLYVYSPFLLLLLMITLRDRFKHGNQYIKSCNWSLLPAIVVSFFAFSGEVLKSLWRYTDLIPFLKNYESSSSNLEVLSFFSHIFILTLIYLFLRFIYKVSIIEVFNLKLTQLTFILKLVISLGIINLLSIYFLDINLLLNPEMMWIEHVKSMDKKHILLFYFVTIILGPIVEESIFRGLIYGPLYRKVGRLLAIILSSLIWSQGHVVSPIPSIGFFIVGAFLAWLYDRSGSLLHPIIFHMFKNSWILMYYR